MKYILCVCLTVICAFNRKTWIYMYTKNQPDMHLKITLKYFGV